MSPLVGVPWGPSDWWDQRLSPNSSRIWGGSPWRWVAFGFVERPRAHIEDLVSGADMVTLGAVPPSKLLLPPHGRALVPSGVTALRCGSPGGRAAGSARG